LGDHGAGKGNPRRGDADPPDEQKFALRNILPVPTGPTSGQGGRGPPMCRRLMGARLELHRIGPTIRMLHTTTDPLFRRELD
jgi:hypothetical protein